MTLLIFFSVCAWMLVVYVVLNPQYFMGILGYDAEFDEDEPWS